MTLGAFGGPDLGPLLGRLIDGFPDLPRDVIASVLGDCYCKVVEITGEPLVHKAEEFATLRLEILTRHAIGDIPQRYRRLEEVIPLIAPAPGEA